MTPRRSNPDPTCSSKKGLRDSPLPHLKHPSREAGSSMGANRLPASPCYDCFWDELASFGVTYLGRMQPVVQPVKASVQRY